MTAAVALREAPDAAAAGSALDLRHEPRRRRRRTAALTAGVVAVVAGGAIAAPRAAAVTTAGDVAVGGEVPSVVLERYGARGAHVVGYEHGAAWTAEVPVRNDGPVPFAVTGASLGDGPYPLLVVRGTERLVLGPGEQGVLRLRGTADNCRYYHERESQVLDSVALELSVLGVAATRDVALARPLLVRSPMIVGCPDRVLDRRQVNRR